MLVLESSLLLTSVHAQDVTITVYAAVNSLENTISAYTTVNESADSMTVIIVNRDMNAPRNVTININGFATGIGTFSTLELSALPATETFISHIANALKKNMVTVISNSFIITVPALSTTAVLLAKATTGISEFKNDSEIKIFPNPAKDKINVSLSTAFAGQTEITIYDMTGRKILNSFVDCYVYSPLYFDISTLERGVYFFSIKNKHETFTKRFSVIR